MKGNNFLCGLVMAAMLGGCTSQLPATTREEVMNNKQYTHVQFLPGHGMMNGETFPIWNYNLQLPGSNGYIMHTGMGFEHLTDALKIVEEIAGPQSKFAVYGLDQLKADANSEITKYLNGRAVSVINTSD